MSEGSCEPPVVGNREEGQGGKHQKAQLKWVEVRLLL